MIRAPGGVGLVCESVKVFALLLWVLLEVVVGLLDLEEEADSEKRNQIIKLNTYCGQVNTATFALYKALCCIAAASSIISPSSA